MSFFLVVAAFYLLCLGSAYGDNYKQSYAKNYHQENLFIFMFFGIALGAILTHVLSRIKWLRLPYTVVIFLCGLFTSIIIDKVWAHKFGASVTMWNRIDPEMILYIFLPLLLFGEVR